MGTCSATKRKTIIKTTSITSSNADIAIKKERVDRTATITATVVVAEISLLANQLVTQKATTQVVNKIVVFECRRCLAKLLFNL